MLLPRRSKKHWADLLPPYCCQVPGEVSEAFYVFTGFAGKTKNQRADSNR
jgi:hypothetical protein